MLTPRELEALHRRRVAAWKATERVPVCTPATDTLMAQRRADGVLIVAALVRQETPVRLPGGTELRLTRDGLGYAETDASGSPVGLALSEVGKGRGLMFDYASGQGAPT